MKPFAIELMDVFLRDAETQFEQLKNALHQGDKKSLERTAHTIKGSAANICAKVLSNVAHEIEKAAKAGQLDRARDLFGDLKDQFERFKAAL
ncbi:MAG: Hpt domain-containing protein [Deltaproteobacteria bacterium]|nr:Hpt domain-containing protein [Deltaproteobacteria bacterium]MBW2136221.1 Hpt domain-containing protein [Deltaproteobacteria bacterium]